MQEFRQSQKQQYCAIDLMKFFFACGIVAAHTLPFTDIAPKMLFWTNNWLIHIPVPFFFATTGFFLYRKMPRTIDGAVIRRYWIRIFHIYWIWTIIYLPLIFLESSRNPGGMKEGLLHALDDALFVGSYFHLWFIRALLVAVPFLSFLLWKRCSFRQIFGFFGCTYLVYLLFSSYHVLYQNFFSSNEWISLYVSTYASLFVPFPPLGLCNGIFVSVGAYAAFHPIQRSAKFFRNGLLIALAAFLIEGYVVHHLPKAPWYDASISLPFLAYFLLGYGLRIQPKPHAFYLHLRKLSMLIYYSHALFWRFTTRVQEMHLLPAHSLVTFSTTLALTLVFSEVVTRLSQYPRYKILKNLF